MMGARTSAPVPFSLQAGDSIDVILDYRTGGLGNQTSFVLGRRIVPARLRGTMPAGRRGNRTRSLPGDRQVPAPANVLRTSCPYLTACRQSGRGFVFGRAAPSAFASGSVSQSTAPASLAATTTRPEGSAIKSSGPSWQVSSSRATNATRTPICPPGLMLHCRPRGGEARRLDLGRRASPRTVRDGIRLPRGRGSSRAQHARPVPC